MDLDAIVAALFRLLKKNALEILAAWFVALLPFAVAMEFRNTLYVKEINRLDEQTAPLIEASAECLKMEEDLVRMAQFRASMQDWMSAKVCWAEQLETASACMPTNLEIARVTVRGTMGGRFARPDEELPLRFVPKRDFRVQIDGIGQDAETAGSVARYVEALTRVRAGSNLLSQVRLQGIQGKPLQGQASREFALLALGSAGREVPR